MSEYVRVHKEVSSERRGREKGHRTFMKDARWTTEFTGIEQRYNHREGNINTLRSMLEELVDHDTITVPLIG
ncbi:hypothetical protein X798_04848 [Onchocerca flexuosa]|uniref:Uncharacterized protein n=1 Tax=Onchocerca flexuosa TaxID=387005 RepID=A0A238BTY4_9BILA|nr:hypothetical protein X798_04848 [Onchocerca flexuosa]